jgi:hypothetical protein
MSRNNNRGSALCPAMAWTLNPICIACPVMTPFFKPANPIVPGFDRLIREMMRELEPP